MGDLIAGRVFEIITVVVIPFIVQFLKKIKLPTKLAPFAAIIAAIIIVAGGKFLGVDLEIKNVLELILKAIGLAGISVLGYDIVKKITVDK